MLSYTEKKLARDIGLRRAADANQWEKIDESIWMSTYQDDYDFARVVAADPAAADCDAERPLA